MATSPTNASTNQTSATGQPSGSGSPTQIIGGAPGGAASGNVIGGSDLASSSSASGTQEASGGSSGSVGSSQTPDGSGSGSGFALSAGQQSGGGDSGSASTGTTTGSAQAAGENEGRRFILQSVSGEGGATVIMGTAGNDTLVGTSANEVLDGGLGQDRLTGGAGADRFAFEAGGSIQGAADLITDFRSGAGGDRIDLSGLRFAMGPNGAIDLAWGGTQPTAYGVWYDVSGGITRVYVDTDGTPASAESVLNLSGNHVLTAADFLGVKQPVDSTVSSSSLVAVPLNSGISASAVPTAANVPATITGKIGDTLTETDSVLSTSGRLVATDPDSATTFVVRTNVNGNNAYGKFSITASGDWIYSTNTAQNQFQAGRTYTDSVTVTTADGTQQVLTVTIVGTNDAAVITGDISAQITETDGALSASGRLNNADIDSSTTFGALTNAAGSYGSFSIDARGNWSYQAGANNALTAGQTVQDRFTVVAADGTTQVITLSITGTNDAPVFGPPTVTTVTEDALSSPGSTDLVATGSISVADADQGEAAFRGDVTPAESALGHLVIGSDGRYTYSVANADTQHLGAGQSHVDQFTVSAADGTPLTLRFTITGTNDAAVIGAPSVAEVTEDADLDAGGNLVASGSISIRDADDGEAGFSTTVSAAPGNLGTLSLAADGRYTYTVANSATQSLGEGQTRVDSFTVSAVDGTTQTVRFTVHGSNDAAQIGVPTVSSATQVTEDANLSENGDLVASGNLSVQDIDAGEARFNTTVTPPEGALGTLLLTASGAYTYLVADSDVQHLGAGETRVETFTVTSVDGTTQQIAFTIHGTNDTPVIGAPTVTGVTEDGPLDGGLLTATGTISITDADTSDLAGAGGFRTAVIAADGTIGSLVLSADGHYTYAVDNAQVQQMVEGEVRTETFTVTAVDGTTQQVRFTITGTNDAAVIGAPSVADVSEDAGVDAGGRLVASGSISITDADQGEARFNTAVSAADGNLGTLSLSADGRYTYTVSNAATQALAAGESRVETFTVSAADGTTQKLAFTIHGTNDAAVIGAPSVSSVTEDADVDGAGLLTASGSLGITDTDGGEALFSTAVQPADGTLGHLSLGGDGRYTYSVANGDVQQLAAGQTLTETFTVNAIDGSTRQVSFTITGTNDAAVIGAPAVAEVTEDMDVDPTGHLVASGSIGIEDADAGEASFVAAVISSKETLGVLALTADGQYTYTVANSDAQSLGAGETAIDTFTITAADGSTRQVSFTVQGTNDAAVITGTTTASLTETDGVLEASGSLSASDVDGDAGFSPLDGVQGDRGYGRFSIDADGQWTYQTLEAHDWFEAGQSYVDTVTVTTADGTEQQLSVTITGSNDAASITASLGALDNALTESDAVLSTGGTLSVDDVDNEFGFQAQTDVAGSNGFGTFSIDAQGAWTYTTDGAQDAFVDGQTYTDAFVVQSLDGTTQTITVTITGTNDAAVLSSSSETLTETDEPLSASGQLAVEDIDSTAAFVPQDSTQGSYGSFSIDADGAWTFTASEAFDRLNAGDSLSETFTVQSVDGTRTSVTVTIQGTNDAAQLSSATETLTETDEPASASGQLTIADVDSDARFVPQAGTEGSYGRFSIDADGAWTFTASEAFDRLNVGDTLSETFEVQAADGTRSSVSITIRGTNDAAVLSSATETLTETDEPVSASGQLTVLDVDSANAFVPQTDVTGAYGRFSIDADGAWTFTASEAYDTLAAGDRLTETFEVQSVDGTRTSVTVNITGTNDAAVLSSAIQELTETDAPVSASGQLTVSDVDGDARFVPQDEVSGAYGRFSLAEDGAWTFTAHEAFDALNKGDQISETFEVQAADGTRSSVTVRISGTNDAAVLSTETREVAETDEPISTGGQLSIRDVDGDGGFVAQDGTAGTYGSFSIDATGAWTFTALAAMDELNAGDAVSETFEVESVDGARSSVTVRITGTNDAAVLGTATATLTETDEALSTSGRLAIADVDSPARFVPQSDVEGSYGRFSIDTTGAWTFTASEAFDALNLGDTLSETFEVQSDDGTRSSVTIRIAGSNDAAVLSSASSTLTETDEALSTSGQLTSIDGDGPTGFVVQDGTEGQYGSFSINADGAWSFTAHEAFDGLNKGDQVSETFEVQAADGTRTSVSISIRGTNDAAVLSSATETLTETDEPVSASGQLTVLDVDSANAFVPQTDVTGAYGRFSIDADGAWTFTASEAFDRLQAGDSVQDSFEVESADGTITSVTLRIEGTNDAARITGTATASLTETDGLLQASGALSATDPDSPADFNLLDGQQGDRGYGKFSISADGHWSYTTNEAHDWFEAGQSYVDTVTVTTADGTEQQLSVTITGSNDAASITASLGALDNALTEGDAVLSTGGTLSVDDVDNEFGFQAQTDVAGSNGFGTFSIDAQGAWTYTTDGAQDAFVDGQTYTDAFVVQSLDGTTQTITVTITGTNDAAVLSSSSETLTETDEPLSASGQLAVEDIDSTAAFVPQDSTQGSYGSFSIDADGAWTFTASEAFDRLNAGDSLSETFTVQSVDGTRTSVTVTIQGTNDAAQLSSATETLTETDEPASASGQLTIADVDSDARFVPQAGTEGSYGRFSIDADGAWTFTASEAFDRLNVGDTLSETFEVQAADGTRSSVSITIRGTNDAAVLSSATETLTETDEPVSASGQLTVLDVDSANAFVPQTDVTGAYGRFSIDADGAWTFTASEAFDRLQAGDSVQDSFEVESADGTITSVTLRIEGTNDAARITGTATASLTETDGLLQASGALSATDPDSPADFNLLDGQQGDRGYGKFSISADGHWSYTTNEAHDWFEAGQSYVDTVTVTTADGTEQQLSVTITGSNDAASITASLGALDNALTEGDAVLSTGGTLSVDDVDNEFGFQAQTDVAGSNGFGTFSIDAQGAWTYTTDGAQDAFVDGQTYTDAFVVQSLDGTTQTITVTITGTNDAAVLSAGSSTVAEADAPVSASGQLEITDVDSEPGFRVQDGTEGQYGSFSINAKGAWTFTAHDAYDRLNVGDTLSERFSVESADGTTTTVTITIEGSNDAAVITGQVLDQVIEIDSVLSAGGRISATDVDNDDASFVVQDNVPGDQGYGVFSIDSEGYWSYTANSAHNQFAPGVTYTDTLTVKTADGTEQVITVELVGTNDVPVVSAAQTFQATEDDASPTVNAFANASDVDEGTTLVVTGLPADLPAGVSYDSSTGTFTLDLSHAEYQQLKNGELTTVTVNYSVSDGIASVPTSVSWTVAGANDAPVVKAAEAVALTEDATGVSTIDALAGASDADSGDVLSVSLGDNRLPAGVSYDAETHQFTLDPASEAFQSLGEGVSQTVTVNYEVSDGTTRTPASISWTVTGTNDAPVVSGTRATLEPATEDERYTVTLEQLLQGFSDVDSSDTLVVTNLSFDQGTVTDNGDGTYTVTPGLDYNGQGTLSYTVGDGHTTLSATLALNVTAVNDVPTTSAITLAAMDEDSGSRLITQADLLANAADVDNDKGDLTATRLSLAEGSKGTLVDNEDGTWTFTPAADDDGAVSFSYQIVDGSGGQTAGTATMDLTPVDDLSRISGKISDQLEETNAVLSTGGTLVATDVDGPDSTVPFVAQTDVAGSGGWGKFSINAQGEWTYTANSAHDAFKDGETFVDTLTVAATDGVEQLLTVTLVGTNDAAVITGKTASQLTETNAVLQTTGQLGVTDVDGPAAFIAQTGLAGSKGYGTLDITANGLWTYTTTTARNEFAPRTNYSETVTVKAADGTEQTLTISLRGTNDAPVVQVSAPAVATEDAAPSTVDALAQASDVDEGTLLQVTQVPTTLPDGVRYDAATHSFTLDPGHASYQSLAQGQSTTVTVNYAITDGVVARPTPASISWTVTGTNDGAVIGTPSNSRVIEDTAANGSTSLVVTGSIGIADVDNGEGFFQTTVTGPGTNLGSLALQADGSYTYKVDNAAVQYLGQGDTLTETFTVTAADGTQKQVSFTLQGTNDAPVVRLAVAGTATEDGPRSSIDALANASDVDRGTTLSVVNIPASLPAGVSYDAATKSFVLDPSHAAYQPLAAGATQTVTVNYGVSDGTATTPASVSWTVTGTNDGPVATNDTASATERGGSSNSTPGVQATGNLIANDTDVDGPTAALTISGIRTGSEGGSGTAGTVGSALNGSFGALTLNADGSYSYAVNENSAAVQALPPGGVLSETFTYTVRDADGRTDTGQLTVTVQGANDAPTAPNVALRANQLGNGGFDAATAFSGWTVSTTASGMSYLNSSTATIDRSGSRIAGDQAVAVLSFDGDVPNAFGTGYGPSITSAPFAGQAGDTVSFVYQLSSTGDYAIGTGVIRDAQTGAVVQTVFNYQTPFSGSTGVVTQNVVLANSGTYTIEFRIGSYDASGGRWVGAQLDLGFAGILRNGVGENEPFTFAASNFLAGVTDPDGGSLSVSAVSTSANGAVLTLNGDGSVVYNPNGALDFLAAGQQITDTFQYTVSDGRGGTSTATASLTVVGANDAPVVSGTVRGTAVEDSAPVSLSALANASDVDRGTTLSVVNIPASLPAGVSYNAATKSFVLDPSHAAYQPLAAGATQTVTVNYGVSDGTATTPASVSWTVTGTNDGPVATNDTASATERGGSSNSTPGVQATGNVIANDTDVDGPTAALTISGIRTGSEGGSGTAGTVGSALNGSFGTLTLNADGSYSYAVNENSAAVQALPPGGVLTETFTYTVSDAGGRTDTGQLTVTVQGANDAPTAPNVALRANQLGNGGFDAATAFSGWTVSTTASGMSYLNSSTATIDRSGSRIAGDQAVAVLSFDGDVPNAFGTGYGPSITSAPFAGQAGDTVSFVYQLSSTGDYAIGTGVIRDAQTGAVVQTVFNYQTPFSGSTGVVTQNVVLANSGTYTIEFRIGSYDASGGRWVGAQLDLGFAGILRNGVGENEPFTFAASNFLAGVTDPDGGSLSVSAVSTSANGAVLTLNGDGSVVYNPNGALDFLAAGQQITDTFQYTVSDGRGGTSTATASLTVVGANDAPVVSGTVRGTAVEDSAPVSLSALANASDVDRGTTLSVVNIPASLPAGVSYNAATKSFVLDPSHAAYQPLAAGATQTVTVNYGVSDGTATTPASVSWTVTGTTDAPVAVADSQAIVEGAGSFAGSVATNDSGGLPGTTLTYARNIQQDLVDNSLLVVRSTTFDGKEYFLVRNTNGSGIQLEALEGQVRALGGHVATISSAQENSAVMGLLQVAGVGSAFIGINDTQSEGSFAWIDGSPVSYSNFAWGEPNNAGNEDYVEMYGSTGQWNDRGPGATFAVVEFSDNALFSLAANGSYTINANNTAFSSLVDGQVRNLNFNYIVSDGTSRVNSVLTVEINGSSSILQGNLGPNVLTGGAGRDVIDGGAGNDLISGGLGADYLTGGTGADTFVFNTAPGVPDTIRDFQSSDGDRLELSLDVFAALQHDGQGHLTESIYFAGSGAPQQANQHLVFDQSTGLLSYDADGGGSGAAQPIAKLDGVTQLTQDDFKLTGPTQN